MRCAFPSSYLFRCALPSSYLLRCVLPSSYLLRCVLPSSYLLRCVLPSALRFIPFLRCTLPSCFCVAPYPRVSALRVTLLFLNCVACYPLVAFCRLPFAPHVYRSLFVCVFLSLFPYPYPISLTSPLSRISLYHFISPFLLFLSALSPFLIPYVPSFLSAPIYLLSSSLSHISFPLPYPISPSLSPIPYLLPSPLSHISSFPISFSYPKSPFHFSPYLLFSNPPYLLSFPLLSPYPKPSGRHCSPARWTSRPRWCNAQECMERPMSVYIRVCLSTIASIVRCVVAIGGGEVPLVARARISLSIVSQSRKEGEQIFIRSLFFQKKKYNKIILDNIFFTRSIEFFVAMLKCGCVEGNTCTH